MNIVFQRIAVAAIIFLAFGYGYLKAFEYFTGVKFSLWQSVPTAVVDVADPPLHEPIEDTTAEDLRALIMALRDVNRVYQDQDLGSVVARQTAQAAVEAATAKLRAIPADFSPGAGDSWYYAMVVESRVVVYILQKDNEMAFYMAKITSDGVDEENMTHDTSINDALKTLKTMLESA